MKKILKTSFVLFIMLFTIISCSCVKINAEETITGSLTIICREQPNGQTTNNPMKGIVYCLLKVDDDTTLDDAQNLIGKAERSAATDDEGKAVFNNLELGRYFAYILPSPNAIGDNKIALTEYENFLVDIPMTNADGTGLIYDVTVEPKVKTAYGNLEITKTDMEGNPIQGVQFEIIPVDVKLHENGSIGSTGDDKGKNILTTDENGKIAINNIPSYVISEGTDSLGAYSEFIGYRVTEIYNPNDEYIVSGHVNAGMNLYAYTNSNGIVKTNYTEGEQFGSGLKGGSKFLVSVNEADSLTSVTIKNEKPGITKKVQNSLGEFVDSIGASFKDNITFKITADVPNLVTSLRTFKITDNIPSGLTLNRDSIVIEGATTEGFEVIPEDAYTLSESGLEIIFNVNKLGDDKLVSKYSSIFVTYDVTLDEANAIIGGDGNINLAELTYSNLITQPLIEKSTKTISDTAEVHTGAIKIEKTDKQDANIKLSGAKFKIATSEANAKSGIFVTNRNNEEIEVISDSNGIAEFKGLAYSDDNSNVSYWLVETEAPKYKEIIDGVEVEKSYNLLKNPVKIQVGKTTYNVPIQIKNSKGINLPLTGGIGIILFIVTGLFIMILSIVINNKNKIAKE